MSNPNPSPPGNQPLQNMVVVPLQAQAQPNPAAGAGAPQAQAQQVPRIQMSVAERIGVNNIVNEFRQVYKENFGNALNGFEEGRSLEDCVFWICREVDSLLLLGHTYDTILSSDGLMRRVAVTASNGLRPRVEVPVPFENHPFHVQVFLMNLTIFVVRYLNRPNPNNKNIPNPT